MTEAVFFKLAAFIISTGFILVAWLAKKMVGHWLNPSSIFSLFWSLYTILPLVVAFNAPINPAGIIYILFFNIAFASSVVLFDWKFAFKKNQSKPSANVMFDTKIFHLCFYFVFLVCCISLILGVLEQGFSIAEFFVNPMAFAGKYAGMRYGGELKSNIFSQLGLTTSYIVIVLGGIMYGVCQKKKHFVLVLSFLPSILIMALQSAKGLFFFSIFMFAGSLFLVNIYNKSYTLFDTKGLKKIILYGSLVLPVIIMSFLSRGLHESNDLAFIIQKVTKYLVSYSSVHLYAFSDWFSQRYFLFSEFSYRQEQGTLGFYTLMSVFRLLGDTREVPMGIYDEFFFYGDYLKGNLYTVFRGIITDFTLIGSLAFSCFVGFFSNFFFYRLLCTRSSSFYAIFFIFFISISYQTYIISSLTWITIPVVFFTLVLFLFVYYRIYRGVSF